MNIMRYLLQRQGWYLYNRRVPNLLRDFDPRERVRIALGTKCLNTALKKVAVLNDEMEYYWQNLLETGQSHSQRKHQATVKLAKQLGFRYMPALKLAQGELVQILNRILSVESVSDNASLVSAVLGGCDELIQSTLPLSKALEKYWHYSQPQILNKTSHQQRKWRNARKKAVKNFIKAVGDKDIVSITPRDLISFRDAWLKRMKEENIKADTVNKDFTHLKGVLETVATHEELEIDIDKLFRKIYIKETGQRTRQSFKTNFIRDEILKSERIKTLDIEAQSLLKACIATGARPIELVHLREEDIKLEDTIPHIHIRPYQGYTLKTFASTRKIPLIGIGLNAFIAFPQGFERYRNNSDLVSATLNAYLTKYKLRPTKLHSLYSFRHSFQDRLNALELPDRIQCQLMGHTYPRPKYGTGATLEHLQKIIKRVDILGD